MTEQMMKVRASGETIAYEDRYKVTPADQSESGKIEITRRLNRAAWNDYKYGVWNLNMGFLSFWDLEAHDCKENDEVWQASFAPLRIDHFGTKWVFWAWLGGGLLPF